MRKVKIILILLSISLALILLGSHCVFAENSPSVALDGVQIRLTETRGIRYIAEVSGKASDYDEVGMLILPYEMLNGELTLDTPDAGKISSLDEGFNYFSHEADSFRYTLCLIGLTHEKYDREYVVRPYVKYTDGGVTYTVYGENSEQYISSPIKFTENTLMMYADKYGELPEEEQTILDGIVTDYYKYLEENKPEEEPEETVPEEAVLLTLNEWYWKIGTLASANGSANETRADRLYTPSYIPATDETVISFDKANGVSYIVMEYNADKEFISSSGWITADTYTKRNSDAAYFRCVINDGRSYTKADIKELSSHLSIMVPKTNSYRHIGTNEWQSGTLQSAGGTVNTTRSDRIVLAEFLPTDTIVSFDTTSGNSWLYMEYTEDYLSNSTHVNGTDYFTSSFGQNTAYEKVNSTADYCRFAMRNSSNSKITDIAAVASSISIKLAEPVQVYHTFFEQGDISENGDYAESSANAYTQYYIPADVRFTYDTTKKFTYKISYYDSDYTYISSTNALALADSPTAPENASFYRISVCPSFKVAQDNIGYIGSAFDFKRCVTADEWELGTVSASAGGTLVDRDNRMRTPGYYPAANISVKFTASDDVTKYYVLGYDRDKNYIGTSDEQTTAVFSPAPTLDGAYYYRFAIATTEAKPEASVATAALDIGYSILSPEKKEVIDDGFEYVDDENALLFRFGYNSIQNYSPGNYLSGICMVEDELWLFSTSDKGSDGYGVTLRYSLDLENKTATYIGYFKHNFGHTNSINYNSENKALTFGNGGADFSNTSNYFYVYENAYETIKNGATVLELSDAICYDWADCGISYMTKLNTAWYGNSSVFVVANNNGYVYKIALGTGTRQLSLGTMTQVDKDSFNGTWEIIKTYEMSDNKNNAQATGFRGQPYEQCNQGTHFADGTLYLNLGHDGAYFWKCKLYSDGSISRDEFHKYIKVGTTTISSAISGIEKCGDYLIFSNGNYVHVYRHDLLK